MTSGASYDNRRRNLEISNLPPVLNTNQISLQKRTAGPIAAPSVKDLLQRAVKQLEGQEGTKEEIKDMIEAIYPHFFSDPIR